MHDPSEADATSAAVADRYRASSRSVVRFSLGQTTVPTIAGPY